MTPEQERSIQLRVGFFALVGLILIAGMVTYFGRFGENIKRFYEIRVEYPSASGLLTGAEVLMAGAKVGKVAYGPEILPSGAGVFVTLRILETVRIPANSSFTIGSSGLLGDRFVDITMPPAEKQEPPLLPGQTVRGQRETGIGELASRGEELLADVRKAVNRIDRVVARIDEQLLDEKTLRGVGKTVANLEGASETLAQTAKELDAAITDAAAKVDGVLAEASDAVQAGKKAMDAASGAANGIEAAAADFRKVVQDIRKSEGALGLLLYDRETAENIRALIRNLRARGVLFYRDKKEKTP